MGVGSTILLERSDELQILTEHLETAVSGHGSVLVMEGWAGVGKTALLNTCRDRAGAKRIEVHHASGGSLESELSWGVVRQLFADVIATDADVRATLLDGAAALAMGPLGLDAPVEPSGAFHGLYWLTVALAQAGPLLLAIDDTHWADLPSLEFLAYLSARVTDLPVCIVASVRRGEPEPEPLVSLAVNAAQVLRVRELSAAGSAEVVRDVLGAEAADSFCAACHSATGGNPFLLRELLVELEHDRVAPVAEHASDVASITPESVKRSVLLRLTRLSDQARELAAAAAVLGDGAALGKAATLAGIEPAPAGAAADSLTSAGILREGHPLGFVHPLVREVIHGAMPAHERSRSHNQAARLLAREDAGDARVATHLLLTEPSGDKWVVERLRTAARTTSVASTAADLLQRALDEPPVEAERAAVLAELGRVEFAAGRAEAAQRMQKAVELSSEPPDRARAMLDLGRALYVAGQARDAADTLDRGLKELNATGAQHQSLAAELQAAWLAVARTEEPLRAQATELLHELAARPPGPDSYGERTLLAQVAGQLTFDCEPRSRSLELARAAVGDGELIRHETSDGTGWIAAAGALGWGDDFDSYDALHATLLEDARRRGSVIGFANASHGYNFSHYHRGMLADAIADAEQAIAAGPEGWMQFLPAARAQLAWALTDSGELDQASAELSRASEDRAWEQSSMRALVLESRARNELARGDPASALASALAAGEVFERALIRNPSLVPWRSCAALAAHELGEVDQAQELLDEALALAQRFGAPRPIGIALTALGIAQGQAGIEALEQAVGVLADSPAQLHHARALVHLGAALRHRGRLKDARETLRAGLTLSTQFGATALAQRASAELAAAGARVTTPTATGAAALTPAELRVARLAAEGLSNREIAQTLFVSLRTVETHLTHVYQKLHLDSRARLVGALNL